MISLSSISCGKNHTVAVEAPPPPGSNQPRRVFSWGCGNFGCLGHRAQADEYSPRLIESLTGAVFSHNRPTTAACGSQCSMVLTEQGHVYYFGKHRSTGEATMRPAVMEALANNHHVVSAFAGGSQTVVCGTKNGNTVSWGVGPYGELGYGASGPKSSSKPKFVEKLDKCISHQISCGYGHTLFILADEDDEDKAASSKLQIMEEEMLDEFDVMKLVPFESNVGGKKGRGKK